MLDKLEEFLGMDATMAMRVAFMGLVATVVRLLVDKQQFSVRGFLTDSTVAVVVGYFAMMYCLDHDLSVVASGCVTALVGLYSSYILKGLVKIGESFAADPLALIERVRNIFKRG